MTGKTGARPPVPAKAGPVTKTAPKPQLRDHKGVVLDDDITITPSESAPTQPAMPPSVHRAGGWIDRGDGRGWELED